jgi:hypothetical protein
MNIRYLFLRLQDSDSDLSKEIEDVSSKLTELGVDFESQDIGEPDKDYLFYLKDMLPVVQDDEDRRSSPSSFDSLSGLLPHLDFAVTVDFDDTDGSDFRADRYEDLFSANVTAGDYSLLIFGFGASLSLGGYIREGGRSSDYDVPDDPNEAVITDSDFTLESIAGIYVFETQSNKPIVYFVGSAPESEMREFEEWSDISSAVSSAPKVNIPQFGDCTPTVLKSVDSLLEEYIGSQTYSFVSEL